MYSIVKVYYFKFMNQKLFFLFEKCVIFIVLSIQQKVLVWKNPFWKILVLIHFGLCDESFCRQCLNLETQPGRDH